MCTEVTSTEYSVLGKVNLQMSKPSEVSLSAAVAFGTEVDQCQNGFFALP